MATSTQIILFKKNLELQKIEKIYLKYSFFQNRIFKTN